MGVTATGTSWPSTSKAPWQRGKTNGTTVGGSRVARNRQDRAEWRERRKLRRRMGLEPGNTGNLYDNATET